MKITLLGLGMGTPGTMTAEAAAALARADAVLGAGRLLQALPEREGRVEAPVYLPAEILLWLEEHPALGEICVVFSGDSGFFSGATRLRAALLEKGYPVQTLPGIGTPAYLCARLGMPWQDVHLVSAHGRDCDPLAHLLNYENVFFLTGGEWTPGGICARFADAGLDSTEITVGEKLSYPDERIISGTAGELRDREFAPLSAVLARRTLPAFCRESRVGGIADDSFLRGEVPMTKREARALILSMLVPREDETLWDIGAGTGSVAVEMALAARWGQVYAVERTAEGCALIAANRERFGVFNLACVQGTAPGACEALPAPGAVFIGGSAGRLEAIVRIALQKNPHVRVVISAVTLETMALGMQVLRRLGFGEVEAAQIAASRAQAVGGSHLLRAQNPIFLMSGRGGDG